MELRQLKYFVNVATTLNFSEAARKLYITQGTLSQQIKCLEDELNVQLFERSPHSVRLTESGEELLPLAKQTIESSLACSDRMKDLQKGVSGTLKIGTTQSFQGLLANAVLSYNKAYPGVKLKLYSRPESDLLKMLRDKEIDLALTYKVFDDIDDVESEVLFRTSLGVLVRKDHPLAQKSSLTLDDIRTQKLIIPGRELQARKSVDRLVGINTKELEIVMEMNDQETMSSIVQGSFLAAIATPLAAWDRPSLRFLPLDEGLHIMSGCVHSLKNTYKKRSVEAFLEELHKSANIERISKDLKK